MQAKNYYDILGSPEDASQDEIERLYKRLAFRHHPDRGGDVDYMRAINEAYQVLGNEFTRRAYDARRKRSTEKVYVAVPPLSRPLTLLPNTLFGRLIGALFILFSGILFLFFVMINYLRFMWPIVLLTVFVLLFGVLKVHEVMVFARKDLPQSHALRRYIWVQELLFWSIVAMTAYTIYILIRLM